MIWIFVVLIGGYALLCFGAWLMQEMLVFPGTLRRSATSVRSENGVMVSTADGLDSQAFRIAQIEPKDPPRAVFLLFVGNGEDLTSGVYRAEAFRAAGIATVVPEYPGYGTSEGSPTVDSVSEVARITALRAAALAKKHSVPLVLVGSSLGTLVASGVAAEFDVDGQGAVIDGVRVSGMVLRAPPSSIVDAGAERFWFLPVRLLMRDKYRFDTLARAPKIHVPTLVLVGSVDRVVPPAMARRVADAIGKDGAVKVQFEEIEGHGHNVFTLDPVGDAGATIEQFLTECGVAAK